MSKYRILMMCPYFGPLPVWFHLFKLSCEKNEDVDFLFFTDQDVGTLAPNMGVRTMSFLEFRNEFAKKLNLKLTWTEPHKLCDLKPALGYVFHEHIEGYTHWGFMDMDVLLGRIRTIYDDTILANDVISAHTAYISGHFSVFSNRPVVLRLFAAVKDWAAKFQDPRQRLFDEDEMGRLILGARFMQFYQAPLVKKTISMDWEDIKIYFCERHSTFGSPMLWRDGTLRTPGHWEWRDGKLTAPFLDGEEMLYVHFMQWVSKQYITDEARTWSRLPSIVHPDLPRRPSGIHISGQGLNPLN